MTVTESNASLAECGDANNTASERWLLWLCSSSLPVDLHEGTGVSLAMMQILLNLHRCAECFAASQRPTDFVVVTAPILFSVLTLKLLHMLRILEQTQRYSTGFP